MLMFTHDTHFILLFLAIKAVVVSNKISDRTSRSSVFYKLNTKRIFKPEQVISRTFSLKTYSNHFTSLLLLYFVLLKTCFMLYM